MTKNGDPAEPAARGTLPCAKQSWGDLFQWRQRTEEFNEDGESRWVWRDLGLFAWTADAFDFHGLTIQQVKLPNYYGVTKTTLSTAVTMTLLLRSIGSHWRHPQ